MFKIFDLAAVPSVPLENGRGNKVKLVDDNLTATLDLHLNTLNPGGASGRLHKHSKSDNVYIVRSGEGELNVEGKIYTIRRDQIIFIPAGLKHSLNNVSDVPLEIFEIYAPAGADFDFIHCK
jgi:mannose-6-phosphate isomerase-like protein (cupin superfamily)